ncbi:ATP-binding protein [Nocardioides pelophilus]|uniref:ATP-binding protein n=1 Tax=Nocardioides pelophilus TaxID=2172019 RepID=UPI001602D73D|nr:ATP-binding protein [Nocardioides pelophilus]
MRARAVRLAGTRGGFLVLYLLGAAIGRASVVDIDPLALVWPAAGLAVVWLITRPSTRSWLIDIPMITLVGLLVPVVLGLDVDVTLVLASSNLVAVLAVVYAVRRWSPETGQEGVPPTSSPTEMFGFLLAATVGSLVGVAFGALGYWAAGREISVEGVVVWWGRNVCGMIAVSATALLIVDRVRRGRPEAGANSGKAELALLFGATTALLLGDYATELPVSFLLPTVAVWAGSRFSPLVVAAHALFGGFGILWLTAVDHGPFANHGSDRTTILLAQLFIAMTLVIGLVLAAARQSRAALQADLLAQEREQSQELLTFARRAAHDLRNPLSVVESWTAELYDTLGADPDRQPPGATTMIAGIERATARMRTLVDDLLADAAARDRAPEHAVVDLQALVAEVAAEYDAEGLVRTHGPRSVTGDPVLIRQLFDNLIANALKYIRAGDLPDITIASHHQDDRVVVRAIDNGIGIPDGAHEWIFEPFRRAHDDSYPGTGLGLSTCRRIVERHGGTMRAYPREDGPGTVFEFDLPPAQATTTQPALTEVSA